MATYFVFKYQESERNPPVYAIYDGRGELHIPFSARRAIRDFIDKGGVDQKELSDTNAPEGLVAMVRASWDPLFGDKIWAARKEEIL